MQNGKQILNNFGFLETKTTVTPFLKCGNWVRDLRILAKIAQLVDGKASKHFNGDFIFSHLFSRWDSTAWPLITSPVFPSITPAWTDPHLPLAVLGEWASHWTSLGFPGGSDSKEPACHAEDVGSIPGSGRSPAEENGYPPEYCCLENSMDREAWWAIVHGVAKSQTWMSD